MFKSITLEVSLKPFKKTTPEYIQGVLEKIFDQWAPLIKNREEISIMFWSSDGSELLDYSGNPDDSFEWCYFVGNANKPMATEDVPAETSIHMYKHLYMENPPVMTYKILAQIVKAFKEEGKKRYPQSKITVGTTFDIGPEFAISDFKYNRHPEICTGNAMGAKSFVNSYGVLDADSFHYAGFPDGIPDKTPFGKFLGRQAQHFMTDMDFDYLWLSNGVGFTAHSWSATGEIFDGKSFYPENLEKTKKLVFDFWHYFREECPYFPIETRGTNMSAGVDYASDAVCLYDIYNGGFNLTPPPNSPWAALNGHFDLELMGHMTRICELPGEEFMFRYYIHDPWWVNSPWYDRYNGKPHDIYLPMAISRIDENGNTRSAELFNILTIDNTLGDMPDSCVNEPLPHILKAEKDAPDEPALFTWIYPFREFTTAKEPHMLRKMLSEDWFISNVIGNGLPISTVVSCDNFIKHNKDIYKKSILISSVPTANSDFEKSVLDYADNGGKVVFYGSIANAGERFLNAFRLTLTDGITEAAEVGLPEFPDIHKDGVYPTHMLINELSSNGRLDTLCDGNGIKSGKYSISAEYKNAIWFRAISGSTINSDIERGIAIPCNGREYIRGEILFRYIMRKFGCSISFTKPHGNCLSNVFMLHRHNNAQILSVMAADTTVEARFRLPLGAPIFDSYEAELNDGEAAYRFPRADHMECRVYVEQNSGIVGVKEEPPVNYKFRRKIRISGLENATVRFFGEEYCKGEVYATLNVTGNHWHHGDDFEWVRVDSEEHGTYWEARNVTGTLMVAMPFPERMEK